MTRRTIGAAVSAPKPPSSTIATHDVLRLVGRGVGRRDRGEHRRVLLARDLRGTGLAREVELVEREAGEHALAVPFSSRDRAAQPGEDRVAGAVGQRRPSPSAIGGDRPQHVPVERRGPATRAAA